MIDELDRDLEGNDVKPGGTVAWNQGALADPREALRRRLAESNLTPEQQKAVEEKVRKTVEDEFRAYLKAQERGWKLNELPDRNLRFTAAMLPDTPDPDTDFELLLNFSGVRYVDLSRVRWNAVSEAGFRHLAAAKKVQVLKIPGYPLTRPVAQVVASLKQLVELDAPNARTTDDGLRELAVLPALRVLNLAGTRVFGENLDGVTFSRLESLSLANTGFSGGGVRPDTFPALKRLSLTGTTFTGTGLTARAFPALEELDLSGSKFVGDARTGDAFPALKSLNVRESAFTGTALAQATFPALTTFTVGKARIERLPRLPAVERIDLNGATITEPGWADLAGMTTLNSLDVDGVQVTDEAAAALAKLTRLETLRFSPSGLVLYQHLPAFANHTRLALPDATPFFPRRKFDLLLPAAPVKHLAGWQRLTALDLSGYATYDADLAAVGRMTGLERLDLTGTNVTWAGVAQLASLPKLQSLTLAKTAVTDEAVLYVAAMAETKALRTVDLTETKVSEAARAWLLDRCPKLTVVPAPDDKVRGVEPKLDRAAVGRPLAAWPEEADGAVALAVAVLRAGNDPAKMVQTLTTLDGQGRLKPSKDPAVDEYVSYVVKACLLWNRKVAEHVLSSAAEKDEYSAFVRQTAVSIAMREKFGHDLVYSQGVRLLKAAATAGPPLSADDEAIIQHATALAALLPADQAKRAREFLARLGAASPRFSSPALKGAAYDLVHGNRNGLPAWRWSVTDLKADAKTGSVTRRVSRLLRPESTLELPADPQRSYPRVTFHPNLREVAVWSAAVGIRVYDLATKKVTREFTDSGVTIGVDNLNWSPDGNWLSYTLPDRFVVRRVTDGAPVIDRTVEGTPAHAWSADGVRVATVSTAPKTKILSVAVFDPKTGKEVGRLDDADGRLAGSRVIALGFGGDGSVRLEGATKAETRYGAVLDPQTGRGKFTDPLGCDDLLTAGGRLVVVSKTKTPGKTVFTDAASGEQIAAMTGDAHSLAGSRDGNLLFALSPDGWCRVTNVKGPIELAPVWAVGGELVPREYKPRALRHSSDGSRLGVSFLTTAADNLTLHVRVWSTDLTAGSDVEEPLSLEHPEKVD
ncbi:MAG: hypothetical protein K2X82_01985 [Gemmataceae bacterium]|nr:hypothetical protein [Gemmataceae bacterium]